MAVLEVLFLCVFWTWAITAVMFLRNTFLPRLPVTALPGHVGLPCEPVEFQATDGVDLSGWKIASDSRRPWVILCHGLGANRADLLDLADRKSVV